MRKSNKRQRRSSLSAAGGTPSPSRSQDGSRFPMDLTPSHYHSPVRHYDNNATGLPRDPVRLSLDNQIVLPGLYGRLVDYSSNTPYTECKLELVYYVHPSKKKYIGDEKDVGVLMSLVAHTGPSGLKSSQYADRSQFVSYDLTSDVVSPEPVFNETYKLHTEESLCSDIDPNRHSEPNWKNRSPRCAPYYSSRLREKTLSLIEGASSSSQTSSTRTPIATPLAYEIHTAKVPCSEKCIARYTSPASGTDFTGSSTSYLDHWGVGPFLNHPAAERNAADTKLQPDNQRWQNYCWMVVYHDEQYAKGDPYAICTRNLDKIQNCISGNTEPINPQSIYAQERNEVGGLFDIVLDPPRSEDGFVSLFHTTKMISGVLFKGLDFYNENYIRWFLSQISEDYNPGPDGHYLPFSFYSSHSRFTSCMASLNTIRSQLSEHPIPVDASGQLLSLMQDIHNQNIILHSESEQTQPSESKDTEKSDKKDKRRKRKYADTTDTIIYKKHDDNDDNDNPPSRSEPSTRLGKHSFLSSSRTTRSPATQKGNSSRSHGRRRSNQLPDGLSLRYAQDLFGHISQQVRETVLNRSHDAPAHDEREAQPRPALG